MRCRTDGSHQYMIACALGRFLLGTDKTYKKIQTLYEARLERSTRIDWHPMRKIVAVAAITIILISAGLTSVYVEQKWASQSASSPTTASIPASTTGGEGSTSKTTFGST